MTLGEAYAAVEFVNNATNALVAMSEPFSLHPWLLSVGESVKNFPVKN